MKKLSFLLLTFSLIVFGFSSCSKNNQNATFQVMLTDAPADYQQVLIDIQDVQIHASSDENQGSWQSLQVEKGVYNLLDFSNGMDTLLATIELPAGNISQMRLVLGTNNQVKVNGVLYSLSTPSAQQSGLKFNIHANLTEGITYKLWIDFDAGRSIVEKGNGTYSLKPVIRTFTESITGAISGKVSPTDASPYVTTIVASDTIGTVADSTGKFLLHGIPSGTYTVYFQPKSIYSAKSVTNVLVNTGEVTKMDTVFFSIK